MEVIEKYNEQERRYKNVSKDGRSWMYFLCNYDDCNDQHNPTTTYSPHPKTTTKKPSSSSMASISLPLLMFTVLGSILVL